MNDTILHHTLRNRTSAKLLLCRQWIERINYESVMLLEGASLLGLCSAESQEYSTWFDRHNQDMALRCSRHAEDGYYLYGNMTVEDAVKLDSDVQFMPSRTVTPDTPLGILVAEDLVEVWRKAVSNG